MEKKGGRLRGAFLIIALLSVVVVGWYVYRAGEGRRETYKAAATGMLKEALVQEMDARPEIKPYIGHIGKIRLWDSSPKKLIFKRMSAKGAFPTRSKSATAISTRRSPTSTKRKSAMRSKSRAFPAKSCSSPQKYGSNTTAMKNAESPCWNRCVSCSSITSTLCFCTSRLPITTAHGELWKSCMQRENCAPSASSNSEAVA